MDDPLSLMIVGGLAFLGLLFWLAVAAVMWIVRRRMPRASLGFAGACLAVGMMAVVAMPPGYSEDETKRIERLHADFAPVLEAYRGEHGVYPPTLEAAGISTPQTQYGPLRYHPLRDENGRPAYDLSFGDYDLNGFTASWSNRSGHGRWYLDT